MSEPMNLTILLPRTDQEDEKSISEILLDAGVFGRRFWIPLLFVLGTIGNCLSILVFSSTKKYRQQSASYYLSALAISDTVYLLQELWYTLAEMFYHFQPSIFGPLCPLTVYLAGVAGFMSPYLTVAFSFERFIAIHYPLSRPRLCTCSRALKVIAGLMITALVLFSYILVVYQARDENDYLNEKNLTIFGPVYDGARAMNEAPYACKALPEYGRLNQVTILMDGVVNFIIPFVLIAYFNLRIAISVHHHKRGAAILYNGKVGSDKTSQAIDSEQDSLPSSSNGSIRQEIISRNKNPATTPGFSEDRVTKLLLTVSAVFLLLNSPYYLCLTTRNYLKLVGYKGDLTILLVMEEWSYYLFFANFAVNFLLYSFSGSHFRVALKRILFQNRTKKEATDT